jgi:protein ImuA
MTSIILRNLAQRIRDIEVGEHQPREVMSPLVIPGLAEALPDRQIAAGSLVELLSVAEGAGTWTLALIMAKHACGEKKALVIADAPRCFYPPAAARLGVDLSRTIVIRPKLQPQALAALVQSLRSSAVGAAIGTLDGLSAIQFRRLQLAAETGGGVGFLLRPASALRQPSFAAVRLLVAPVSTPPGPPFARGGEREYGPPLGRGGEGGWRRRVQVEVVRFRGGKSGQSFLLEIDDEEGHVHLLPPLASAKVVARSARASG